MNTLFNWTSIGFLLLNFGCQSNPTSTYRLARRYEYLTQYFSRVTFVQGCPMTIHAFDGTIRQINCAMSQTNQPLQNVIAGVTSARRASGSSTRWSTWWSTCGRRGTRRTSPAAASAASTAAPSSHSGSISSVCKNEFAKRKI